MESKKHIMGSIRSKNASRKHEKSEDSDPVRSERNFIPKKKMIYADHFSEWGPCTQPVGFHCTCATSARCVSAFAAADGFWESRKHSEREAKRATCCLFVTQAEVELLLIKRLVDAYTPFHLVSM